MAKNSKAKKVMDEALGAISAAQTILDKLPDLSDINFDLSLDADPISFIMEALYRTVGYDKVIEFVAKMLTFSIPVIEQAVKAYMILQLKNLFTCTVNPFISYDLIKYGVTFGIKEIDIINMLYYCPLDKTMSRTKRTGKYYYFGCDDFQFPDELESAQDFNAFLWYMKNRTIDGRCVWYGYKKQAENAGKPTVIQKQKKKDGIITLEYAAKSGNLRDSVGSTMYSQTPYDNCLHVFLGNAKPLTDGDVETMKSRMASIQEEQSKFMELRDKAWTVKNKIEEKLSETEFSLQSDGVYQRNILECYSEYMDNIIGSIDNDRPLSESTEQLLSLGVIKFDQANSIYTMEIPTGDIITIDAHTYNGTNGSLVEEKKGLADNVASYHGGNTYLDVKDNYYYHKTLFQFNADYIYSLKLFDSKTLAARLLESLTGCFNVGLDLSIEERVVQAEVDKVVHDIVESDDAVITDCFFSFTNDEYNDMLERSELQRLGVYVSPDGAVGGMIDPESVMSAINGLAPNATQEEIKTAIETSLFELTKTITPEYNGERETGINYNLRANMIDNLLQSLANVIVMSVLTPKVYLLMAVNLKILGQEPNFDLMGFIDHFRQLIVGIIRTIRDNIMQMFKDWLMEIIGDLAKRIGAKLVLEQMQYYQILLKKCIDCFKLKRNLIGWNMADVGADIYDLDNNEPVNEEC